ncbi:hypothetical protein FRC04_003043 [Tulasnella sp. 424]|nr:hypothetical protein FRC04_003043 [Tulasnella sp. 424]
MTSTASLHFGPEWMRKPTRPSPVSPATNGIITNSTNPPNGITSVNGHHTGSTAGAATTNSSPANTLLTGSSYSSLLASPAPPEPLSDSSNPFRYSREQMYNVWKNGGGQGELGLEVERWPGIVREDAIQPLGLTEYSPDEKRLYALPYNSDPPPVRRRGDSYSAQSPLATTPGGLDPTRDRNKLANPSRGFGTPGSIGSVGAGSGSSSLGMGLPSRRKKDENGQGASGNQNGPPSPGGAAPPGNTLTRSRLSGTGFDGVMQDSWAGAARRRVSEPRAPITTNRAEDKLEGSWRRDDSRYRDEITEEPVADWEQAADSEAPPTDSSTSKDTSDPMSRPESARQSTPNTDPPIPIESHLPNGATALPSTADLQNPEDVSWCYKDPTGQVQGPFTASTMQSWYLGNYFTDDLLLKRVDVDPDFEELQDFKRRVLPPGTPETLFLSRIAAKPPVIPPGLPLGPGPVHPLGQLPASLGRPDPFAHDSPGVITSPIVSDPQSYPSPTVSGAPFGNAFPQLGGLGIGGFGSDIDRQRREREDFLRSLREKELASRGVGVAAIGGIGSPLGGLDIPNGTPLGSSGLVGGVFPTSFASPEPFAAQSPIQSFGQPSPFGVNGLGAHQLQGGGLDSFYNPVTPQNQQQPIWPRTPHSGIPEQAPTFGQTPVAVTPSWMSIIEQQPPASQFDAAAAAFHNAPVQQPTPNTSFGVATPWNQQTTIEAPIPSVISEVLNQTPIEVAADTQEPTALEEEPQDLRPDPVESELIDPSTAVIAADNDDLETGLKAMDLNQAPVPEEVKQAIVEEETTVPTVPTPKKSQKQSAPPATKSTSAAPTPTVSTISQSGVSVASSRSAISAAPASAVEPEQPATTTSSTATKTVWTNFAEEPKPSSLRKIQEAEAKRAAEAKKVEKERAKTAAATAVASPASTAASVAEATGSWGLPQVGRAPTASAPSPAPSTGSAGGVWATKPTQVTKKSMKEIQDEEEKRKKAVAQAQAAAAAATAAASAPPVAVSAAKRGYADSAKPTSGATPSQPNGWTTVGGGKAAGSATPAPAASNVARPAPTTSRPSTANVPGASAASSSTSKPATKPIPSTAKSADEIPPPSLEFIRWMREALRGLTGANVDEFMQMLLSFPLDPSPTVVEIISDSVYASSATLDGRRFASEFVAKRKADAANAKAQDAKQAGAWAGRVSIAEVVKTQPKPAESEWSTRVVKKNKKSRGNGGNGN